MSFAKQPAENEAAWRKLFNLAMERNHWMEELSDLLAVAKEVSPAEGRLAQVDTAEARRILDKIDELTPQVAEAAEEFNREQAKLGRGPVTWENYDLRRFKSPKKEKKE